MGRRIRVLLLAGLLLVAGCGGGDPEPLPPDEYRERLVEVVGGLAWPGQLEPGEMEQLAERYEDGAERLGDTGPPPEAAVLHQRLVTAMDTYAAELRELADAGRAGEIRYLQEAAEGVGRAREFVDAANALAERGWLRIG